MSDLTTGVTVGALAAVTLELLGVEPQSLVYAAMGAGIGTTWAPEMGRFRAVFVFTAVICLSAVAGTVIALQVTSGAASWRNLFSGVIAIVFHPLASALVMKVPDVIDGVMKRLGLKQ